MPGLTNPSEKRTQPRYTLRLTGSGEVLFRRTPTVESQHSGMAGNNRFRVETVNISTGGFMLSFDTEVSATDTLMLYFNHPETKAEFAIEVQVQWIRKNAAGIMGRYVAGVALRRLEEQGLSALVEYAMTQNPTAL